MYEKEINGLTFKNMLIAGFNNLKKNAEYVNDLNVFPIPDGDTGDNMLATMYGGINAIKDREEENLGEISKLVGKGMLLSARGNSGVILSQMFAGITDCFSALDKATPYDLGKAFRNEIKKAYASVQVPVEGTMLTVIREATDYAEGKLTCDSTAYTFIKDYLTETEKSIERTPDLLPILKEAGVIDSGGEGIKYIIKGFENYIESGKTETVETISQGNAKDIDFSLFNENSVMEFGYCTEFLLQLTKSKTDIVNFSLDKMKEEISVFGDSLVAVKTGSIVKIHIHTLTPGAVLNYAQAFGEFLTLKIENMTLQHSEKEEKEKSSEYKKNEKRKKYGVIAVGDGQGIIDTFTQLGADIVIDGGQGKNPSVETFVKAFDAVNADVIFVLPNNPNIVMAAKEGASLYKGSDVTVIETKSLGEGYAVLSVLDTDGLEPEEIAENMRASATNGVSAMVSVAIRDTVMNGVTIKEGDYIGFQSKKILCSGKNRTEVAFSTIEKINATDLDLVVVFYGKNVSREEKDNFESGMASKYPSSEFYGLDGGQDVYDYVIIID